jgi:hypothetical protein
LLGENDYLKEKELTGSFEGRFLFFGEKKDDQVNNCEETNNIRKVF